MRKVNMKMMLVGMIIAFLGTPCLHAQTNDNELAWKQLKKMRVRAGVLIGKVRATLRIKLMGQVDQTF